MDGCDGASAPSLFDAQNASNAANGNTGGGRHVAKCDGGSGMPHGRRERLSPMCAMNTPRTRSSKGTAYRRGAGARGGGGDDGDRGDAPMTTKAATTTASPTVVVDNVDVSVPSASSSNTDGRASAKYAPSILLPNVDDDGDHDGADPIETTDTPDSSPGSARLRRSVSITRAASCDDPGGGYDEGVELCRRRSRDGNEDHDDYSDDDEDYGAISRTTTGGGGGRRSGRDTDEEENALLLDEIRKDVIRTHPDLRFFLEPREDLGQKRYAALERILFVWAKLNKGVSLFEETPVLRWTAFLPLLFVLLRN